MAVFRTWLLAEERQHCAPPLVSVASDAAQQHALNGPNINSLLRDLHNIAAGTIGTNKTQGRPA
jgi:hypothetical protein